eukprot:scaffold22838_cov157-Isochrysis_galbana.AAC.1
MGTPRSIARAKPPGSWAPAGPRSSQLRLLARYGAYRKRLESAGRVWSVSGEKESAGLTSTERIQKKMITRASYEAFREKRVRFKYGKHRKNQMRARAWCEAFREKRARFKYGAHRKRK